MRANYEELETSIAASCKNHDYHSAATRALKGYGPEIYGYLIAATRREEDSQDIFSTFCERLWKSIPTFAWRSTFRTWAYVLARRSVSEFYRRYRARGPGVINLSEAPEVYDLAMRIRTTTPDHVRSEVKERFRVIREQLSPEEQTLFILRLDRHLPWLDITRVMLDEDDPSEETLKRTASALRKKFQRIKDNLRPLLEANMSPLRR